MRVVLGVVLAAVLSVPGVAVAEHQAPPPNDRVDDAVVVASLPFEEDIDASAATTAPEEPVGCFEDSGATLWYRLLPEDDVTVDISTAGSHYDTTLDVFEDGQQGDQPLDCDDNGVGSVISSRLQLDLSGGSSYLLRVAEAFGEIGHEQHLRLSVQEYEPFTASHRFHPVGEVWPSGEVWIRHASFCNDTSESEIHLRMTQDIGPGQGEASSVWSPFYCYRGEAGPIEKLTADGYAILTVRPDSGTFTPGPAIIEADVGSCSYGRYQECVDHDYTVQVLLLPRDA